MPHTSKKRLLTVFFILLLLPLLQQCFPFVSSTPLFGIYDEAPDVVFSWKEWFSGEYQAKKNDYLKEHMGFRADLVRLKKQLDYSLYTNTNSTHVIAGTNGVLYQKTYINAYYGDDFIGKDAVVEYVRQLKAIQDTMAAMGKTLLLAHAPCKAYFYPNDFPENMRRNKHTTSNYDVYAQYASAAHINQLDFNAWFCALKGTASELLYSKQGIHWTWYGALLAADSISRYLEHNRKIKMMHPVWDAVTHTTDAMYTDDDIAATLNLVFPVCKETFTYPRYSYPEDATQTKPKIIMVGDSFGWTLIENYYMKQATSKWEFWYYYRQRSNVQNDYTGVPLTEKHKYEALDSADCVLLLYTSHNLHTLGDGFIKHTYAHYFPQP